MDTRWIGGVVMEARWIAAALAGMAILVFLIVSPLSPSDWLLLVLFGLYGT